MTTQNDQTPPAADSPGTKSMSRVGPTAPRPTLLRGIAFGVVAVMILGAGIYLAGGVFLSQRDRTSQAGAISMRISMAGYDPSVLEAKPGQTLTIDWWNTDGMMHLQGGVHTMVSDSLGLRFELPANSRKTISLTAPMTPGDYDFWCDSCCGGKASAAMHGTLRVRP